MPFLRAVLLVIFGLYSFFALLFCLFGLVILAQDPGPKSIFGMANSAGMAFCSVRTFLAVKRDENGVFRYASLLFLFGFFTTAVYRVIFVADAPSRVDATNALIFGIPAVIAFGYAWPRRRSSGHSVE